VKLFVKLFILVAVLVCLFFIVVNVFVNLKGKTIISSKLSQLLEKDVTIGSISILPPYSVSVKDFEIAEVFSAKLIKFEPSLIGFFFVKVGLNNLIIENPSLVILRDKKSVFNIQKIINTVKSNRSKPKKTKKDTKKSFFIKEVIIRNGKLFFKDESVESEFFIKPVEFYAITTLRGFKTNLYLLAPLESASRMKIGEVNAKGWLNFVNKDMDVVASFKDIDAVFVSNYFNKKFLKEIKSGKITLAADMISENNDLTINCHLETNNLQFGEEDLFIDSDDNKPVIFGNLSGILLDSLIGPGGKGVFDFSINTKFDRPRLESLQFEGNVFQTPVKNLIKSIPLEGKETIEKIGNDFKEIGKEFEKQFKDIGDQFKSLIEDSDK